MASNASPELVIRLGSHSEKEYVLKLAAFFDGLIVGANLFEATPGATASLLIAVGAKSTKVYVDPMTYAYGPYVDPITGRARTDLDWIKSDQTRKDDRGKKIMIRDFKRSYRKLATELGEPIRDAVEKSRAVEPASLKNDAARVSFCAAVTRYQLERINREFVEDEELKKFIDDMPRPAVAFAPYFYVEPSRSEEWLRTNLELMSATSKLGAPVPIHGILCADVRHLADTALRGRLVSALPATGIAGIWLWFSGFFEDSAETAILEGYRDLVARLSDTLEVHAMHGGFLSLALSKFGMCGVSHGVGYGEQKDVVPVIGQSTPTVRYYLPAMARRLGVPQVERAFDALGIKKPADFHKKVCGCAVCKGVVSNSLDEFSAFGDTRYSRPSSKRQAQTPAAAKRCRFHFLLSRIQEREDVRNMTPQQLALRLTEAAETWGTQPSLTRESSHLKKWVKIMVP